MMNRLNVRQMIGASVIRAGELILPPKWRNRGVVHQLDFSNPFIAQLYRHGKCIKTVQGFNGVTVVGKNHLLDVAFGNSSPVTQIATWYIGLVDDSPTPVFVEADTLASHTGWTEFTGYAGTRKAWDDANAASKVKGTTTVSTFVCNTTATINGILVASVTSGTSGILWATGSFDTTIDVINLDEIKVTYGIRL